GVDAAGADDRLDLADEGDVAQQQAVGAEDGRLVLADLAGDAVDDGVEVGAGGSDGLLEAADLGGDGADVEVGRLAAREDTVHAERAGDGHTRRDGDSLSEHRATSQRPDRTTSFIRFVTQPESRSNHVAAPLCFLRNFCSSPLTSVHASTTILVAGIRFIPLRRTLPGVRKYSAVRAETRI